MMASNGKGIYIAALNLELPSVRI